MEIKDLRSAFFFQNQLLEVTGSVRANTFTIIARRNSAVTRAIIFRRATSWWRSWSGCRKPCTASGSRRPSPIPTRTIRSCRCGRKLRLMSQQWLILAPWKPLPSFPIESNRLKRMELNRPCRQWRRPQKKHLPKSRVRVQCCLPVDGGFVSMTMSLKVIVSFEVQSWAWLCRFERGFKQRRGAWKRFRTANSEVGCLANDKIRHRVFSIFSPRITSRCRRQWWKGRQTRGEHGCWRSWFVPCDCWLAGRINF